MVDVETKELRLRKAAETLLKMYVANPRTQHEFVSCHTTPAGDQTALLRPWLELRDALEAFDGE